MWSYRDTSDGLQERGWFAINELYDYHSEEWNNAFKKLEQLPLDQLKNYIINLETVRDSGPLIRYLKEEAQQINQKIFRYDPEGDQARIDRILSLVESAKQQVQVMVIDEHEHADPIAELSNYATKTLPELFKEKLAIEKRRLDEQAAQELEINKQKKLELDKQNVLSQIKQSIEDVVTSESKDPDNIRLGLETTLAGLIDSVDLTDANPLKPLNEYLDMLKNMAKPVVTIHAASKKSFLSGLSFLSSKPAAPARPAAKPEAGQELVRLPALSPY